LARESHGTARVSCSSVTERKLQLLIERRRNRRTTFVIAHRLTTVRQADVIIVLDRGTIVERGTFDELIAAQGSFSNLVAAQASELKRKDWGSAPGEISP
jgi:ABC-type multidrug transport system fused ATPase/permease subunit